MEAGTPGQPITTKVSPSTKHLNYVNIWVGLYSSLVYITFHTTKDVSELLKSKEKFELWAKGYNITIKDIRADNGVYAAKAFQSHCMKHQQHMTFCAVGAHWQNRITKRFMGTITKRAHNKLFHTLAKLPSMVSKHLWLFAIHHSINYHNSTIHQGKTSCPHKLLTGEETKWKLQDFVFSARQPSSTKTYRMTTKQNKWTKCAWKGVYIGHSSCHTGSMPLIYNLACTLTSLHKIMWSMMNNSKLAPLTPLNIMIFWTTFTTLVHIGSTLTASALTHISSKPIGPMPSNCPIKLSNNKQNKQEMRHPTPLILTHEGVPGVYNTTII